MSLRIFIVGIFAFGLASTLRADLPSPVVAQTLPTTSLGRAGANATLNLYSYINDPNVPGTAVRMTTTVGTFGTGNIDIALFDQQTPLTVANFLAYINAGDYANNIIHRSDPGGVLPPAQGFVIQGGGVGFFPTGTGSFSLGLVPTFAAIQNEPGISNVRGTIAMAKQSGNVNSATSQWFINLSDSNTFLDSPASGSFTAFGKVIGNGMAVADIVSGLSIFNYGGILTQLPLTANNVSNTGNFVITNMAIVPAMTYTASSANTSLVTVGLSGNTLTMTPSSTNIGSTNITINATDMEGGVLQSNFTVTVLDTYANWKAGFSFGNATLALEASDPDHDGLANLAEYAFGGDPLHSTTVAGAPKVESGGGVVFYIKQQAALSYEVDRSVDMIHWTKVWASSDVNALASAAVFAHTSNIASGFDQVTIRDPSPPGGNIHFLRVQVTRTF